MKLLLLCCLLALWPLPKPTTEATAMEVTMARGLLMLSQSLKPMPSPRRLPLHTTDWVVTTVDTMARGLLMPTTAHTAMEDTMARGPPRLSPTTEGILEDTMARGPLRLSLTMVGILEDTMARGLLRLSPTMEATAMVATMARGLLMLTTEVTAMVATTANALLMPKPTTMAAMAHTAMASKLHGNIHSL